MTVKAIVAQCNPVTLKIVINLKEKYNWEICYIIGKRNAEDAARTSFPDIVFHDTYLLKKNILPDECKFIKQQPIDKKLLISLSYYESIVLKMMNRMDRGGQFTYAKRLLYYHTQVMYWKGVLDHYQPDVVVFREEPHQNYDYILYALCRVLNYKTVMFQRTLLPCTAVPVPSFEDGSKIIKDAYQEKLNAFDGKCTDLLPLLQEYLEKLHNESFSNAIPSHLKNQFVRFKEDTGVTELMKLSYTLCKDIVKGVLLRKKLPDYLERHFYENIAHFTKKRLARYYSALAGNVDLGKPYVFVALQCEPERQASPCGDAYGNQYLMVDIISKMVPEGWMVYVKEHVAQFKSFQDSEKARTKEFYDYLVSKDNVRLVGLDVTSFDLIDQAKASASVSGSVCWESVVRGTPALLFGYNWYQECEGVFSVAFQEDLIKALDAILNGYQVDYEKVKLFAATVFEHGVRADWRDDFSHLKLLTQEESFENLAEAVTLYGQY
jgi:hypothetical protein